ncbi:hypothetical protein BV898_03830 [Hypsibius exemplaris]|uniref:Uncharacterized protein n=1 Tax=Hypsibius exemplaris TaxID=2072580 RepID=A0A1W0X4W6_HYPEX|nr:hypothetical protein BV898_03830 [Hypsibius exemplaris]
MRIQNSEASSKAKFSIEFYYGSDGELPVDFFEIGEAFRYREWQIFSRDVFSKVKPSGEFRHYLPTNRTRSSLTEGHPNGW